MTNEEALDFLEKGDWFQAVYNNLPESTANEVAEAINTVGNAIRAAKKCDQMRPSFISDHSGGVNKMVDHVAEVGNMAPLTLEQLRQMDGKPVLLVFDFELEPMTALVECVEDADCVILTNNLGGRSKFYSDEELRESGIKAYAYPPTHIDLEAWEPCEECRKQNCDNCLYSDYLSDMEPCKSCYNAKEWKPVSKFCGECGRPLTPEARAMLEKRLRGF